MYLLTFRFSGSIPKDFFSFCFRLSSSCTLFSFKSSTLLRPLMMTTRSMSALPRTAVPLPSEPHYNGFSSLNSLNMFLFNFIQFSIVIFSFNDLWFIVCLIAACLEKILDQNIRPSTSFVAWVLHRQLFPNIVKRSTTFTWLKSLFTNPKILQSARI